MFLKTQFLVLVAFTSLALTSYPCSEHYQCQRNAFCDRSNHQCRCILGYEEPANSIDFTNPHCVPYQCHHAADCLKQFARSVCFSGRCICEKNYNWDGSTCRSVKQSIGGECYANIDCGSYAFCEISTSQCRCVPGSAERDPGNVNCRPRKCQSKHETNRTASSCESGSVCDETREVCLPDGTVVMGDIWCIKDEDCAVVRGKCHRLKVNGTGLCWKGNGVNDDGTVVRFLTVTALALVAVLML